MNTSSLSPAEPPDLLSVALDAHGHGLSVIAVAMDGSKRPLGKWKQHQAERADERQLGRWFPRSTGLAIVCGEVSGGLEMLEAESAEDYDALAAAAADAGVGDLLGRVEAGYCEATPGGGFHLAYRCEVVEGNLKLARRPTTEAERRHPADNVRVLVETRGEGGFFVAAPSHGAVHATGRPWVLLRGGFGSIVTITAAEREEIHAAARRLDRMPARERPAPAQIVREQRERGGLVEADAVRVGDDFNARNDPFELLEAAGWSVERSTSRSTLLTRPGKSRGVSAELHPDGWLQVFSTSTPFDTSRQYDSVGILAVLDYGGDFTAAVRDLAMRGYGTPRQATAEQPIGDPAAAFRGILRKLKAEPSPGLYAWAARKTARLIRAGAPPECAGLLRRMGVAIGLDEPTVTATLTREGIAA